MRPSSRRNTSTRLRLAISLVSKSSPGDRLR
ncbi:unnamed protein product [Brugia timori]|uniref:Uncharacterized protein n=1 Tax=Brugia timori TaxID=42155 RepID=A0A3P7VPL5_9BILA|nr:unnamed protein product [Brugia timori]